ncbi:hypothetical protein SUDANB105_08007 [Streptomyces sp. enrichment culture]|uniref:DUF4192 domain-containing protein n=1 Tax=Streptomyces sp. enrichment culture TaxID=1795815 RepID=UPI003F55409A
MSRPESAAVRLNTPADLAEALPYLLGYQPRTSVAAAIFHDGRFTCAARLDLPPAAWEWFDFAAEAARAITDQFNARTPDSAVLYLLDEPAPGQSGRTVATRLAPLAGLLRAAFTHHRVTVPLTLCISANQWWDITHDITPGPGTPLPDTTPGPATVAFTVAGQLPALSEDALTTTFAPLTGPAADTLRTALDTAATANHRGAVRPATAHTLLEQAATAFADPATTTLPPADTATLLHTLSDRLVRDWAMSLPDTHTNPAARRLFTYLATAAVGPHEALACAPLTLLAVSAWYDDDQALARLALRRACRLDPAASLPALLRAAFNLPISTQQLKELARAGRPTD